MLDKNLSANPALVVAVAAAINHYNQQQKGEPMAGRILPASRPRTPLQQRRPSAVPVSARVWTAPTWRTGDKVLWNGYTGTFLRDTVDDHAEVLIGTRTYRLSKAELRSA